MSHTLLAATQSASSPGSAQGIFALAIGGLSAWRGYVRAQRVEELTGRRPWNWSPTVWSVVCFFSLFIGRLCLRAASDRAVRQGVRPPMTAATPAPWQPAPEPAPQFAVPTVPAAFTQPAAMPAAMPAAPPVARAVTILPGG